MARDVAGKCISGNVIQQANTIIGLQGRGSYSFQANRLRTQIAGQNTNPMTDAQLDAQYNHKFKRGS